MNLEGTFYKKFPQTPSKIFDRFNMNRGSDPRAVGILYLHFMFLQFILEKSKEARIQTLGDVKA